MIPSNKIIAYIFRITNRNSFPFKSLLLMDKITINKKLDELKTQIKGKTNNITLECIERIKKIHKVQKINYSEDDEEKPSTTTNNSQWNIFLKVQEYLKEIQKYKVIL